MPIDGPPRNTQIVLLLQICRIVLPRQLYGVLQGERRHIDCVLRMCGCGEQDQGDSDADARRRDTVECCGHGTLLCVIDPAGRLGWVQLIGHGGALR